MSTEYIADLIVSILINFSFRIGLCVFSGFKIYPGMGKTLVKADGKVINCHATNLMESSLKFFFFIITF